MDRLYAGFLGPGGLAFDLGAHVGDRVASFRRLGARVIAVEPQPGAARALRLIHGRDADVTLVEAAAGAAEGQTRLHLNAANPTVTTASDAFIAAAAGAEGWEGQRWRGQVTVPTVTLDGLIARFGAPDFVKIDVEGWEAEALAGLSTPVPALSFEITLIRREVAVACLDRLGQLGDWRFNLALGESQRFEAPVWEEPAAMAARIAALPAAANSGDVYARRLGG